MTKLNTLFNETVNVTKSVDYMINLLYGSKDWNMSSAIREIIANAIDTKTKYTFSWENGIATIADKGTGLPKRAFVMGGTSKASDTTSIGQFGEGLKMCLVTALRNKKKVSIKTQGYGVETKAVHSDEYDSDMMRVMFTDASIIQGTVVKIECAKDEYDKAVEMFLQLRTGYRKLDKNLYLPGGFVSILGLTTEERPNLLFSYDLNDKSLTNRDRNVIKSRKLKGEMEKILSSVKKEDAVKMYLENLSEAPESEEYKISFVPNNAEVWNCAVKDVFGDKVVYSSTSDGDVKAVFKGYKVIPCPTKQVREVLKSIGVGSSAQKTKAVKNETVSIKNEKENKIVYPIASSYVENWTPMDAGRELVSNAFDMSPDATVAFRDGMCVIEDSGVGIERRHFVIGNSEKGNDQIGVFGEGFKMASLVLAREKRDMAIETVGYTYRPSLEKSEEFSTEIFCFHYEKNDRKKGTVISFKSSEDEVKKIKSLFICFDSNISYVSKTPSIDVIDDENGAIYVNGLLATQTNALFSYNIKGDKTIVDSRDRNHVDDARLNMILKDFYDSTSDSKVIRRILSGWEKDPYKREYSLVIEPKMPTLWYGEVKGLYPNTCIFSTTSSKSNFIAETAGYKVLRNIPPYIMQVLSNMLKTADEIAEIYGDKGILIDNQVVFPITSDYITNWKDTDAIRELMSNAFDASDKKDVRFDWKNGMFEIEDSGKGLRRENLIIGNSQSREIGTAIGTFGEGLKLATLHLCKNGRKVRIETVGFTVEASMKRNDKFNSELLVMTLSENDRTVGTKITGECCGQEFEKAKHLFLVFDETKTEIDGNIYDGGETGVYVNGAKILGVKSVGYSYNFTKSFAKHELTRDRNSFTHSGFMYGTILSMLSETKNMDIIKKVISRIDNDTVEGKAVFEAGYMMGSTAKKRWKKAAMELYPDSCLPSEYNTENTLVAQDSNITVLRGLPASKERLLNIIGFPRAEEAVKIQIAKKKRETIIPISKFNEAERKQYDILMDMVASEFGKTLPTKVKVVACLDENEGSFTTLGRYDSVTDTVYIIKGLLSYPLSSALGVVDHEFEHRKGGHSDRTREFENDLTERIGVLLERTYGNKA